MPPFDPGPPPAWVTLFDQAPVDHYVTHPSGRFRTTFGPVYYRGRLDGTARVLIVGQDPSTDEVLAQRILVGEAGQRVQGLLRKLGVERHYLMLNVFLFGITGQFDATLRAVSASDPILTYRNRLFDHAVATSPIAAVIAFGVGARHAVDRWPGHAGVPVCHFVHPTARSGVVAAWNQALPGALAVVPAEAGHGPDPTPYGDTFTPADAAPIPRHDLPFGLPAWHGTGGTHSTRQRSANTITWTRDGTL